MQRGLAEALALERAAGARSAARTCSALAAKDVEAVARRGEAVVGPRRRRRGGGERRPGEGGRVVAEEVVGHACACAARKGGGRGREGKELGVGWVGMESGRGERKKEGVEDNYSGSSRSQVQF